MFLTKELIRKKRDKEELTKAEIDFFIKGVVDNSITNEQISSLAMAIFFNDLTHNERKYLTLAMRDSGSVINFENLDDKPIIDKHSSGGVGDLVSIVLAPLVASCGVYMPMIAGKGLGHTGGTVDKLMSIPNYNVFLSIDEFKRVTKATGCSIIGQTSSLAPADRKIYSIRDTTGTVESIPLIASSILSKKLASGINYLTMDVKVGNGAFMNDIKNAKALAQCIYEIANSCNVKTGVLITDMNESLAKNVGNSLEIKESVDFLLNKSIDKKLKDITFALATQMLMLTQIVKTKEEALIKLEQAISSGSAAEVFNKMVFMQSGIKDFVSKYETLLPTSTYKKDIFLAKEGYVSQINTRELGLCLVEMGGGRKIANESLDLSCGLENVLKIGERIDKKIPFLTLHYNKKEDFDKISTMLNSIVKVDENKDNCIKIKNIYEEII